MKKRTITWSWEDEEAQELFAEWVHFPKPAHTAREIDQISILLGLQPSMKILDVGCGTGRHAIELAHRGYQVTGIDVATSYLEQAKQGASDLNLPINFRYQRGSELTEEQVYDAALAINHTPGFLTEDELGLHFRRIKAALKPGGKFLMLLAGPKITPSTTTDRLRNWAEQDGRYILSEKYIESGFRHETGVIINTVSEEIIEYHEQQRAFSLSEMQSQLEAAGFTDIWCLRNLDGEPATIDEFGIFVAG